jgi:hypothetical protein
MDGRDEDPYHQLRFAGGKQEPWGINFGRTIARRREEDYVVFRPRKASGFVSRFPDLTGVDERARGPALELMPYVTSQTQYVQHEVGDPFRDGRQVQVKGGGDLRAGIGSRLTLNATIRPDFGQVEVDPASVNLTDVETFLDEKRPFFVEGASIFDFGRQGAGDYWDYQWTDPLFFYSRRIGRAPQGKVPSADYSDVPAGAEILGAGKLIGHLTPSWSFGTLHAVTGRESAQLATGDRAWSSEVEPLTYYGVMRGQRPIGRRVGIGLLGTATVRSFEDPRLQSQLTHTAFLGGVDGWAFLDPKRTWVLSGWSAATRVDGSSAEVIRLQRASTHYFQRPDADYLGVDSTRTMLGGWGSRWWINKEKGATMFNASVGSLSPGFEANDLGYLKQADLWNAHVGTGYKWTNPGRLLRYQSVKAAMFGTWDHGGDFLTHGVQLTGYTELQNSMNSSYYVSYRPQSLDNRRTRGGPLTLALPTWLAGNEFQTDPQRRWYGYISVDGSWSESGSWGAQVYPALEWNPVPTVNLKVGPGWERLHEDAQYVTTTSDPLATETYGHRYVFGVLDQTTVSASLRFNWTFSPSLSLETYAQPYVSSAKYQDFRSLVRPRSYDFVPIPYGGQPDFTVRSLKGDAVLRWEYRPGSVLFLAWTQTRADQNELGDFLLSSSFDAMMRLKPDNVYLVKLSYYFTP